MARFIINTTGTLDPVIFYDLGYRTFFTASTVNFDLTNEYTLDEIAKSLDIQSSISNGYITAKDEFNNAIFSSITVNITTLSGGTNLNLSGSVYTPIVNLNNNINLSSVSASTISGGTIYSGATNLQSLFNSANGQLSTKADLSGATFTGQILINSGLTVTGNTILSSLSATTVTATTYYGDGRNLVGIHWSSSTGTNAIIQKNSNSSAGGILALAEGSGTTALSDYTHAEGLITIASGFSSHAEGSGTTAVGAGSHAEGLVTIASGLSSHAEGAYVSAVGAASHAEGAYTIAIGALSHTEGSQTIASGFSSHAEGSSTVANALASHSEGISTTAFGQASHSEGANTNAIGNGSHAEGIGTSSVGDASHSEGTSTTAGGLNSHAGGNSSTASGTTSFVHSLSSIVNGNNSSILGGFNNLISAGVTGSTILGGSNITGTTSDTVYGTNILTTSLTANTITATTYYGDGRNLVGIHWSSSTGTNAIIQKNSNGSASGILALAQGSGTTAVGDYAHAAGFNSIASGASSHAEGATTTALGAGSHSEGSNTMAAGLISHAEGFNTIASGITSHAEGFGAIALGAVSHAEGTSTLAGGLNSHAEGSTTIASGQSSHAEGASTNALGNGSHSEGISTNATGEASHSEGTSTTASGINSHAGGNSSTASGTTSFVHGLSNIVNGNNSSILGGFNNLISGGVTGSTILGGSSITAGTSNTIYGTNINVSSESLLNSVSAATYTSTTTSTLTTGAANASTINLITDVAGASSATFRGLDVFARSTATNANDITGTLMGARVIAQNNKNSGTTSTLNGIVSQTASGGLLAVAGSATTANNIAGIFQAINNSFTTSATTSVIGAQISAEQRGINTITNVVAGQFSVVQNNTGTTTNLRALWGRNSGIFGNTVISGTATNAMMVDIEGWTSGGSISYTNAPEQLRLQAQPIANSIAIRQIGPVAHSRFQGSVSIGQDAAPADILEVVSTASTHALLDTKYTSDISPAAFVGRKARGTPAAPTNILEDDGMVTFGARGYGVTGFTTNTRASVVMRAAEPWTSDTKQGSYISFETTKRGTTTRQEQMRLDDFGCLTIGMSGTNVSSSQVGSISGTSYGARLQVEDRFKIPDTIPSGTGGIGANVSIFTNNSQATGTGGSLGLGGMIDSGSTVRANFGIIGAFKENSAESNYLGYLTFYTGAGFLGIMAERMRLSSAGLLSIGRTDVTISGALLNLAAPTTGASLNIQRGTAPIAPNLYDGDMWSDLNRNSLNFRISGNTHALVGALYTQTADTTVVNITTGDTTLISISNAAGVGSPTLSARYLTPGKTLRVKCSGYHVKGAGNITFKFKLGTTTIISTGSLNSGAAAANTEWEAEMNLTCRSVGASGTVMAQGFWQNLGTSTKFPMLSTTTTTVDTTVSQFVDVTLVYISSNAGNTMTLTNLTIEALN